jgi:short-subunit dehydrogenase
MAIAGERIAAFKRGIKNLLERERKSLEPEVLVITGASAGVGRAVALHFARQGARIGLIARGRAGLEAARQEVVALGGQALVLPLDVSNADQVEKAADAVERTFGPITMWVNAAMVTTFAPLSKLSPEEIRRVTEVTYLGTVHGTMSAYRRMQSRNRGIIIQVGSALAYRSIPLQAPYCAAKAASRGFTDALRSELIRQGSRIQLTTIHLPAVNTPQFEWARAHLPRQPRPVAPVYQPAVIAEAIAWAAGRRKREMHLGHSSLLIIQANKFFPGLLDRYLAKAAWSGQMDEKSLDPQRRDNLFDPVDADFGARGRFDDEARDRCIQFMLARRLPWIMLPVVLGILFLFWRL